ncbi:hypothetical protein [Nonomuraea fuscirosea]|uniref:hypothetical protein n=1 Tax=Nonomuraea fuscirosea TaxID=1291556 RepID=UPI00342BEB81
MTRKVRAWLQERREPYLVVIDNATDPGLLASLLPSHGRARVLITTNDQSFERLATLITLHGAAAAYEAAGRSGDALTGYERVAARFEAVMGPEQTLTKTTKADLERVRHNLRQP